LDIQILRYSKDALVNCRISPSGASALAVKDDAIPADWHLVSDILSPQVSSGTTPVQITNQPGAMTVTVAASPSTCALNKGNLNMACATWDPVSMVWTTTGCTTDASSEDVTCTCDHVASVAVFQSPSTGCTDTTWSLVAFGIAFIVVFLGLIGQTVLNNFSRTPRLSAVPLVLLAICESLRVVLCLYYSEVFTMSSDLKLVIHGVAMACLLSAALIAIKLVYRQDVKVQLMTVVMGGVGIGEVIVFAVFQSAYLMGGLLACDMLLMAIFLILCYSGIPTGSEKTALLSSKTTTSDDSQPADYPL